MMRSARLSRRFFLSPAAVLAIAFTPIPPLISVPGLLAQETGQQTGSVAGRVTDERGAPMGDVQVFIQALGIGGATRTTGEYVLPNVPAGTHAVQARIIGYPRATATAPGGAGRAAG